MNQVREERTARDSKRTPQKAREREYLGISTKTLEQFPRFRNGDTRIPISAVSDEWIKANDAGEAREIIDFAITDIPYVTYDEQLVDDDLYDEGPAENSSKNTETEKGQLCIRTLFTY